MPRTVDGVVTDAIIDPLSVIKRGNVGQLFEQHTNIASRQVVELRMKKLAYAQAWDELDRYYRAASPLMAEQVMKHLTTDEERKRHIDIVLKSGVYLYLPPNSPTIGVQQYRDIESNSPTISGPVTYIDPDGREITTVRTIPVGTKYKWLLDKTAEDWSATSFAKRQLHGVLAKLGKNDKYSSTIREAPTRTMGESEVRWGVGFASSYGVASLLARSGSIAAAKQMNAEILKRDKPTDGTPLLDEKFHDPNFNRSLQLVKHDLECGGIEIVDTEFVPNR